MDECCPACGEAPNWGRVFDARVRTWPRLRPRSFCHVCKQRLVGNGPLWFDLLDVVSWAILTGALFFCARKPPDWTSATLVGLVYLLSLAARCAIAESVLRDWPRWREVDAE